MQFFILPETSIFVETAYFGLIRDPISYFRIEPDGQALAWRTQLQTITRPPAARHLSGNE